MTARESLSAHVREMRTLEGILGVLGWDQQVLMPPGGAAVRGAQMALASQILHERTTDPRLGEWIAALDGTDDGALRGGLRNLKRRHERAVRIPSELVGETAMAQAQGFEDWVKAKEAADFSLFAPSLQRLVDLATQTAKAIDPDRAVYDVLLDDYDPGTTTASLKSMFARLRDGTVELLDAIGGEVGEPLGGKWDVERQKLFHDKVARGIGYSMEQGRLDEAEHPFTVGIGHGDVRITTHYYEDDLLTGLSGTVHECGHGMYEQGIPSDLLGTGAAEAASMGLHESQSRFWENTIGRSEAFCGWIAGMLGELYPEQAPSARALYLGSNHVKPGLIRVYADEVTYNLHIIVRFELERALFAGELSVADLPAAWNDRYRELLGIEPGNDAEGVLQDVHWSGAAFGYFPSYTLGNLYAASLGKAMQRDLPNMWDEVGKGEFGSVLGWLRTNVHERAHIEDAPQLVARVCGEHDPVEDLLDYLWSRYGGLAGVSRG
ncbi:MAG: carboxypeptidase M32 [Deltaproteobacteria bacterium]|nr:MAG: carboxypeptidase M32 [Deltaproteobacteria bacterium]